MVGTERICFGLFGRGILSSLGWPRKGWLGSQVKRENFFTVSACRYGEREGKGRVREKREEGMEERERRIIITKKRNREMKGREKRKERWISIATVDSTDERKLQSRKE